MKRPELRVVSRQDASALPQRGRARPLAPEGGRGRFRSRRDLVMDRVALGPVGDDGLDHIICAHRLKSEMVDRWRAFVRAEFASIADLQLEYEVSRQGASNWWHGFGGPSAAALAQAALTRPDAFRRHFGGRL